MTTPSERMLRLLSVLQSGRAYGGVELAERLGTSGRTLRRDIDRLRELGYPVETTRGPGGNYRLVAGTAMPPLLLADDEAVAIAIGLRMAAVGPIVGIAETAASALRKVEQVLPARLRRRVTAIGASTEPVPTEWPAVSIDVLEAMGTASHRRRRVTFAYRNRAGVDTARRVEPYRQVVIGRRWYLLAWDLDRCEWRTFRVDRISDVVVTDIPFTPREMPDEDAAGYVDRKLKTFVPRHRAVIVFHAAMPIVASLLPTDGALEALSADSCVFVTHVDSYEWLAMRIAILGIDYEIREPADFRTYSREIADRMRAAAAP